MIVLRRLATALPVVAGVIVVTFLLTRALPGDPAVYFAGQAATQQAIEEIRHQLGFDRSLPVQFLDYLERLAHGDLGTSLYTTRPIAEDLVHRLPATIELTLVAMLLAVLLGIPLGVICAVRRNTLLDHALRVLTVSGLAIASFWLAIMQILPLTPPIQAVPSP